MARFYAKFDSGSAGWVTALDNDYFQRLRIGASSASGAQLRDGLIASRSAVSIDAYADLDAGNKNGNLGIYFPPDSGPFSTDNSTFVSWSSAYTSSVAGIVIPADYRTRLSSSISSSQTTLVGQTNPADPIGVAYATYISASAAVKAVLDVCQTGNGGITGSYSRLGLNPSRTLHSIWHDPNLQYFGWDDFTPGRLPTPTLTDVGTGPVTSILATNMTTPTDYQYLNDTNPASPVSFLMTIDGGGCTRTLNIPSGSASFGFVANGSGPSNCSGTGSSTWNWTGDGSKELSWTITVAAGTHTFEGRWSLHDPVIQTHTTTSIQPTNEYIQT